MKKSRIHLGTSGWHYEHWQGNFYPDDLAARDFLPFYARHFRTAEINNSFYRLPSMETFRHWRESVPDAFIFAVKASRYITHMKKLKDPGSALAKFLEHAAALGDKLGPILFQLPPKWRFNGERLAGFLEALPARHRYAFEFRDESWFNRQCYDLLQKKGAAFCIYELAGLMSPREVSADFVYIRLHGPDGKYAGCYDRQTLAGWAGALAAWARQGKEIYCYFDNDQAGYAARNARELQEMLK